MDVRSMTTIYLSKWINTANDLYWQNYPSTIIYVAGTPNGFTNSGWNKQLCYIFFGITKNQLRTKSLIFADENNKNLLKIGLIRKHLLFNISYLCKARWLQ